MYTSTHVPNYDIYVCACFTEKIRVSRKKKGTSEEKLVVEEEEVKEQGDKSEPDLMKEADMIRFAMSNSNFEECGMYCTFVCIRGCIHSYIHTGMCVHVRMYVHIVLI